MKNRTLTLLLVLFYSFQLTAQTKATTEEGKAIIIYEDGTWSEEITDFTDCEKLIKKVTTNKTEGLMTVSPIRLNNKKNSLSIQLIKNENVTVIDMKVDGDNVCFGPKDIAIFTMSNGAEIKLPYSSSIATCKGDFSLFLGKAFKNLDVIEDLSVNKIKSIGLKTHHFNVNEYEANLFKMSLNCLKHSK